MAGGLAVSNRRGRGRRRSGRLSEINVTPFVDVMLVLLIVFMITAPLLTVGVPVQLPRTEAKQLPSENEPLTITVQANGAIYIQETTITRDALVTQMRAISHEGYDRRVFIRADAQAPYGMVAEVMAQLSSAGFHNLGLVTNTMNSPAPRGASPGSPAPRTTP